MGDDLVHLIREIRPGHLTRVACGAPATFGKPRRYSGWVAPSPHRPSLSLFVNCPACLASTTWADRKPADPDAVGHPVKNGGQRPARKAAAVITCPACADGAPEHCPDGCWCHCHNAPH
jgi:hypothetical protein